MLGALQQIGWTMVDPVSIKDHHGQGIILTQGSPARLRKLVHRAIEDMLELQFMDKLIKEGTGTDQDFAGARLKGLNFKPVRRALAAKEVEPGAKLGLRKAFADGVVTAGKLAQMGYKVSSSCPLCEQANDSVFHRAWVCPKRPGKETAQPDVVKAALEAGEKSWLYSRGVRPHEVSVDSGLVPMTVHKSTDWTKFDPTDGPVFHDGSCFEGSSTHPRAAWAAVQIDRQGEVVKSMWGVVDKHMEQSANTAEHVGLLNAMVGACPGCTFVTDCATISNAWQKGVRYAAAARRPHGGIWREASGLLHSGKGPAEVQKCKAHKCIDALEGEERFIALGNDAADKKAKAAVGENNLRGDLRAKVIADNAWGQKVATELGRQLAAWPTTHLLFGELERQQREVTLRTKPTPKMHVLRNIGGVVRCALCNFLPRKSEAGHRQCDGFPKGIVNAIRLSGKNGHTIRAAGAEDRLGTYWCTKCGSHAKTVPRGLARPCKGVPTAAGTWALKLVRQGRDPLDGSLFEFFYEVPG